MQHQGLLLEVEEVDSDNGSYGAKYTSEDAIDSHGQHFNNIYVEIKDNETGSTIKIDRWGLIGICGYLKCLEFKHFDHYPITPEEAVQSNIPLTDPAKSFKN